MKKRIAVIGLKGLPAYGGAATVGENIIEQLKDQYDFTVFSISSHTSLKSGVYKNICYQKVLSSIRLKKLNSLLYYIRAAILVFFSSYDLVHLHHRDAAFIVPFLRLRYRLILTTHGITGRAKKWKKFKWFFDFQLKYIVNYSDIVSCVSKNEQRVLKDKYNINAQYIPNGIKKDYTLESSGSFIGEKRPEYIIFSAGRIIEFKGLDILLEALKLASSAPKLLVIGDLDQEPQYKLKIVELAKGLDIEFLGLIKNKEKLFYLISNSFLFIFPSRQEAMSIMLLEVASLKIPIIASDITENIDVFNDDEVLFFESNNAHSLQLKLDFALNNPDELKSFTKNAFKKLSSDYLWEDIAQKYSVLYDKLLKK